MQNFGITPINNVVFLSRDSEKMIPWGTPEDSPMCWVKVKDHPELQLAGVIAGETLYVFFYKHMFLAFRFSSRKPTFDFPIEAVVTGTAIHKTVSYHSGPYDWYTRSRPTSSMLESYKVGFSDDVRTYDYTVSTSESKNWDVLPYVFIPISLSIGGRTWESEVRCEFPLDSCYIEDGHLWFALLERRAKISIGSVDWEYKVSSFRFLLSKLNNQDQGKIWESLLFFYEKDRTVSDQGLKSMLTKNAQNLERMERESPLNFRFFRALQNKKTRGGISANQLLAEFLRSTDNDYDKIVEGLRNLRVISKDIEPSGYSTQIEDWFFSLCERLPGASEKIRAAEAKKDFRKEKSLSEQATGLGADRFPKLFKAILEGKIPIGIFHQPGSDQPVNREFPLWEKALSQKGWAPVIFEIAANAASRNTYERDITPYLNALFTWPAFVSKHAKGKKWRAMPKFVQSQWELEMGNEDEEEGNGPQKTRKERSAFTPQVDNENRILTIPYVAVTVSGVRTQWCYSRHYHLFQEGFTDPESGGIVLNDLEKNLNGQGDDYGLCYFTLTGTGTARGYPTFLIIFERRDSGETWVHFHRVRPCRVSGGVTTPACELVQRCYQYMAGNIPASEVAAQQGDLIFIQHPHDPIAAKAKVADDPETGVAFEFESHRFQSRAESSITMYRSMAKEPKNRLGFLHAPNGFEVHHPEHDNLTNLEPGWYEIRRCKSYENNPTGIWSLVID